ncbi:MAG: 4-(cytidine 5'-diphospho)-2-C-methyl-D-erythritol kinase [Cyclobacteriaceae bacterium]|nr:4-(cytidine 5'-diphospho)-2-C-methyl-D-erythritol kinase [Cyclobacteriaceae bacterium HetDA_MAG_MS6]
MITFPNAKINLGLTILSRREDGYHNIESCLYPIPWHDVLEVLPASKFEFKQTGIAIPGDQADNLCIKAYQLLQSEFSIPPVQMHLHKAIPMGAGLGGGSADGAFALKMLSQLFKLGLSSAQLRAYAAHLGSDCPFFIDNVPAIATGTGIDLKPIDLDLTGLFLVLINPEIHVSTKEAYALVKPGRPDNDLAEVLALPRSKWKFLLKNNFEPSVFPKHPTIGQIKQAFIDKGAIYAAMSGSGSTVFGLFEQEIEGDFSFSAHLKRTMD